MPSRTWKSITDEIEAGTRVSSRTIVDEAPQVYIQRARNWEEYEELAAAIRADKTINPKDAHQLLENLPPEETFEEAMDRHAHE